MFSAAIKACSNDGEVGMAMHRLDFVPATVAIAAAARISRHGPSGHVIAQTTLDGPGQTLSLVGSGRVVGKFHYTDPTRPDPRTAWVSDKSVNFVWS